MMITPYHVETFLQSRPLPLKKSVTAGVDGLGAVVLPRTATRVLDVGAAKETWVILPEPPNVIEHYRPFVGRFSEERARIVVVDTPGFGFSYPSYGFDYSVEHQAEALVALLQRLKIRQATLVAPGFMGFAALAVAKREPVLVSRVILVQTPSLSEVIAWSGRMDRRRFAIRPWIGQVAGYMGKGHMYGHWYKAVQPEGADLSAFLPEATWSMGEEAAFCVASTFQQLPQTDPSSFEGTDVEVVALWGTADRSYAGVDPESILEHAPQARVVRFEGCGHFPDLEAPDRFEAILKGE